MMFQGDDYCVHYVINLTKPIDYFEDLLQICISNKYMIKFYKNDPTKICVFDNTNFIDYKNNELINLKKSMCELNDDKFLFLRWNLYEMKKKYPKLYFYNDVFIYSTQIKGKSINVMSKEKYIEMKTTFLEMIKKLKNNKI